MLIDKNISDFLVLDAHSIRSSMLKIDANQHGAVICVDSMGVLLGVLTDGDLRRWLMLQDNPNIEQPVEKIINREISFAKIDDTLEFMNGLMDEKVSFLPLIDLAGRCVGVARKREGIFSIGSKKIGPGQQTFVIAEIGNNHNGSFNLACKLVDEAVSAGADCAKFQMRDLASLYVNSGNSSDPSEDLGSQYTLDLLAKFQLPKSDLLRVFDYCKSRGIIPLCTPWDIVSVDDLELYGIEGYKCASADLTNPELLRKIAKTGKPMICSTGMSSEQEILEAIGVLRNNGAQYSLLHCNSTYPAPFKDINLRYMDTLRKIGNCPVGYSSHERGFNAVIAAVALGANIIEKHFTLDKNMEGNDHRVSLLPDEFSSMVLGIRQAEESLGGLAPRRASQGELMNREVLGKSLVMNTELRAGEVIHAHMLDIKSPGRGLSPNKKSHLVGKPAKRFLKPGDLMFPSDLELESASARNYRFKRPFGIPIRFHDMGSLAKASNFDLLEFHLSYKDMEQSECSYFIDSLDMDLVVHAPELFGGDHVLDLCSLNSEYRTQSIAYLKDVISMTLRLKKWFKRAERPRIVLNAGGFSMDQPLDVGERASRYDMILDAFNLLDLKDVEIIPQTMPPFPWHFGGQRFQNLFLDPDEIVSFCLRNNFRVCLDISHSKLACNHFHWSFSEFIRKVAPHTAHLHIVDALGVDGEGLQIGEGDIDFFALGRDLDQFAPKASFIPEIWQGHKNNGEGFWLALERLESTF